MNQREVMTAVLTFQDPPRIGFALPTPRYRSDFAHGMRAVAGYQSQKLEPVGHEVRRWRDEWGNVWAALTDYDKGEVVEGAITDWSQLDAYRAPDLGRPQDYVDARNAFAANPQKYCLGHLPGFPFSIARNIRKLEYYLCDLASEPDKIERLHGLVRAELLKAIDRLAEAGAQGVMLAEDWGTQDRLMISPAMWRAIYKPQFQELCGRAHDHGMQVIMHSCGKMTAIIEDLIECGVNCMQFDQPRLHGIEFLSETFGGRMAFYCPVDIQSTLQTRDAEKIRADAKLMIEKFHKRGGFIAGYYSNNPAIGLTPEWQDIACEAFIEFGAAVE